MPSISHYRAICAEITRLLSEEQKRRKLTNYAIAQKSGVSESMLSLMSRGLRSPSLELMLRIADGIEVDLSDIIKKAQTTVSKRKK